MSAEPPTDIPVEEEKMLCPCCFYHNIPEVAFCKDCGAPLGCFIGLDPMQHIYAEGFAYRRATGGPPSWKVLVGIWILYFPMIACISLILLMALAAFLQSESLNLQLLFPFFLYTIFAGTLLYQTTMNYARKARKLKDEHESQTGQNT